MDVLWRVTTAAFNNPRLKEYHFTNNSEKESMGFHWSYLFPGISVVSLHQTMFTKSINFLASDEQKLRWMPMINNLQLLGCYA